MIILIANAHPYLSGLANLSCPQADKGAKQDLLPHHTVIRKHRTARTLARIKTTQKTVGYLLQPRPDQMSSTCSDPAYPINAPAFIRHGSLRPASRDLSGDARSGNANRTVSAKDRSPNQNNPFRQDSLSPPHPRSIPGRLGREWISNGSGLEREPLARVTPGSLQTISSLYDVSEQARARRHMQCVYFSKG